RPDRRDIGHPLGIRSRRRKLAVEEVGGHRVLVVAVGGSGAMRAWLRTQSEFTHQPGHPLAPTAFSFGSQRGVNAWTAVDLAIGLIHTHNVLPPPRICLAAAAGRAQPPQPGIVAT